MLVTGGYDGDQSAWLAGGDGYAGVITAITADRAAVALDHELVLDAPENKQWQDFGAGSFQPLREVKTARGTYIVVTHGWVGQTWVDPIRLQVGLCEGQPDLDAIPKGGGVGYWVESHAGIGLLAPARRAFRRQRS
ncbi:MAG TPA: hypothetical protein VGY97_09940 [Solirubrobacteraceae bacterium]|nr:hypothetical protein [Solirubrobacteraceae bacterium]